MEWQPIATAPKMRKILLFAVTEFDVDTEKALNWRMETGSWCSGYDDERSKANGYTPWQWGGVMLKNWSVMPTHWMPLPAPPAADAVDPHGEAPADGASTREKRSADHEVI